MKTQNTKKLKAIISKFNKTRVLVIGDLILDEFIWGKVSRISPEAPVPVVWVQDESFMPGGASNAACNITSLGGKVSIAGVVGKDPRGEDLVKLLKKQKVSTDGIEIDRSRPTTLKTRVIAHNQQVVRIDKEVISAVKKSVCEKIVSYVASVIDKIDAVLIEDYGKGLITPNILKDLVELGKQHKKIVTVDPKSDHFSFYEGVTAITPNQAESQEASGIKIKTKNDLERAGKKILSKLKCSIVLITRGEEGMTLFEKGKKAVYIPTVAQEVFDVSGAGDTVISTFTLALCAGAKAVEAAHIANCAAGIVVGKVGTACVNQAELIDRILEEAK